MKKLLPYVLLMIAVLFQGCSSDDDPGVKTSDYYFRFKVDGVQVDYEFTPDTQINLTSLYTYDETNKVYGLQIAGIENIFETDMKNRLTILMYNTTDLVPKVVYSNNTSSGSTVPDFIFNMGYYNQNGELFIAGLNPSSLTLYEDAYVEFEEITENDMKGTFSGKLVNYDNSSGQNVLTGEVEITEGEFYVPRYD